MTPVVGHIVRMAGGQCAPDDYEALFGAAGFSFKREIDTGAGVSILEAA